MNGVSPRGGTPFAFLLGSHRPLMKKSVFLACSSFVVLVLAACGGDDPPPPNNGVNDIEKACEIRATWTKSKEQACIDCIALSKGPVCECPAFQQEFIGKCVDQGTAVGNERNCDFVGDCTSKCAAGDCACVDACYNDRAACRPKVAALDGCQADVCDKHCR